MVGGEVMWREEWGVIVIRKSEKREESAKNNRLKRYRKHGD